MMARTLGELSSLISGWILSEREDWRQAAYVHAKFYGRDRLREFLLGLLEGADTPGALRLKELLTEEEVKAMHRPFLPWEAIWSNVSIDVCTTVGGELSDAQYEKLREGNVP